MGVFLQILTQPEFLHKCEGVGMARRRDCHAIGTTEAIAVAIRIFPDATVDRNIVLQCWIAHMVSSRYFNLNVFTYKSDGWHESILHRVFFAGRDSIYRVRNWFCQSLAQWTCYPQGALGQWVQFTFLRRARAPH